MNKSYKNLEKMKQLLIKHLKYEKNIFNALENSMNIFARKIQQQIKPTSSEQQVCVHQFSK